MDKLEQTLAMKRNILILESRIVISTKGEISRTTNNLRLMIYFVPQYDDANILYLQKSRSLLNGFE